MNEYQSKAVTWCDFMQPDRTCTLMQGLQKESDPRCKYFREPADDCRYLRLVVLNEKGRKAK
ncbi:hypothetical protein SAMN05661091_5382 [Paenibacillus uliginis N3/975]|uniref:Uncharacterized protein n=1 Tax=Paenibacillus uliginis N3/975 TaxID=1313296 RepID=A0A1X7HR05_9BACL|nr:hypothetical protein [Paenibacillus uliginis]SMF91226.1 hypothetical protein SAMN05661091_5382 [Paenibacillus uliginis N3/975]